MLLQDLGQRPIGDALSVCEAAPGASHRLGLLFPELLPELTHEAGLADACIPDDRDQHRSFALHCTLVRGAEPTELAVTADENAGEAAQAARAHQRQCADHAPAANAGGLALCLDASRVAELECPARSGNRPLAGEDLPRLCRLLEPRCDVDGIAADEGARFTGGPDHDLARVQADAELEPALDL